MALKAGSRGPRSEARGCAGNTNRESVAYRSFQFLEFEVRGVRKVTTGKNLTL